MPSDQERQIVKNVKAAIGYVTADQTRHEQPAGSEPDVDALAGMYRYVLGEEGDPERNWVNMTSGLLVLADHLLHALVALTPGATPQSILGDLADHFDKLDQAMSGDD
jgi:hypothetical protein